MPITSTRQRRYSQLPAPVLLRGDKCAERVIGPWPFKEQLRVRWKVWSGELLSLASTCRVPSRSRIFYTSSFLLVMTTTATSVNTSTDFLGHWYQNIGILSKIIIIILREFLR